MEFTGERVVPWSARMRDWPWVMDHHIKRYTWALQQVVGKAVIELGCGAGYGAFMLSWLAKDVTGVDISNEAIAFAVQHFNTAPNLQFYVADVERGAFSGADVYVCFECLEHLNDPVNLMRKCTAVSDGMFLGSMPVNDPGQFHKRAYSKQDIINMVNSVGTAAFYYQNDDGNISEPHEFRGEPKYILWKLVL